MQRHPRNEASATVPDDPDVTTAGQPMGRPCCWTPREVLTRARIRAVAGGKTTVRCREARITLTLKPGEVAVFDNALRRAPWAR